MAEGDFIYNVDAKNFLSYLFLKSFHENFDRLIKNVSLYLSNYDEFGGYFADTKRREIVAQIKSDLLSTIHILNSINLDITAKNQVEKILENLDALISSEYFSKEQLMFLLTNLSKIVASTFLKDLVKYSAPGVERIERGESD